MIEHHRCLEYNPIIMMQELTIQVGALVGTSVLLYFVTAPPKKSNGKDRGGNSKEWTDEDILERERRKHLSGGLQYSAFHRRKFERMASMQSSSSSVASPAGSIVHQSRERRRRSKRNNQKHPQLRGDVSKRERWSGEDDAETYQNGSRSVSQSDSMSLTSATNDLVD